MTYSTLTVEISDAIAVLTFNRPKVLNAFDAILVGETSAALAALAADDSVAAIVVRGAGRAFSAGFDLKAGAATAGQRGPQEWRAMLEAVDDAGSQVARDEFDHRLAEVLAHHVAA